MDWDNTPGTLDEELHEEAGRGEAAFRLGQDPCWNHATTHEGSDDDSASSANPLREVSDDGTADTGAGFHQDAASTRFIVVELLLGQEEGSVGILRGVRV